MDLTSLYPAAPRKDAGPLAPVFLYRHTINAALFRLQEWMNEAASLDPSLDGMAFEQDQRISDVVKREQYPPAQFHPPARGDPGDAEDILQDVFYRWWRPIVC